MDASIVQLEHEAEARGFRVVGADALNSTLGWEPTGHWPLATELLVAPAPAGGFGRGAGHHARDCSSSASCDRGGASCTVPVRATLSGERRQ